MIVCKGEGTGKLSDNSVLLCTPRRGQEVFAWNEMSCMVLPFSIWKAGNGVCIW